MQPVAAQLLVTDSFRGAGALVEPPKHQWEESHGDGPCLKEWRPSEKPEGSLATACTHRNIGQLWREHKKCCRSAPTINTFPDRQPFARARLISPSNPTLSDSSEKIQTFTAYPSTVQPPLNKSFLSGLTWISAVPITDTTPHSPNALRRVFAAPYMPCLHQGGSSAPCTQHSNEHQVVV